MEIIVIVFLKSSLWGKQANLGLKMACPHNFGSTLRIFVEILHNEMDEEVYGNYHNGFSEKVFTCATGPFWD